MNKKIGYISLEIVIICAVLLTSGIGGIAHFSKEGKTNQQVVVKKTEEVYQSAWNGQSHKPQNPELDSNTILVNGYDFNDSIPSGTTKIIFTDKKAPAGVSLTDMTVSKNNGIVSWVEEETYYVSTQKDGVKVIANTNCRDMFWNKGSISYIDVEMLDVSNTTDIGKMFARTGMNASDFRVIGLDDWNVSNVTNMLELFAFAGQNSTSWDIGKLDKWNVSNVKNMNNMFNQAGAGATTWKLGDLSKWNMKSVTEANFMFNYAARHATEWNIGNLKDWNVSSLKTATNMFYGTAQNCNNWSLGDLSNWDLSSMENIDYMFSGAGYYAKSFNLIGVDKWDTSNILSMNRTFYWTAPQQSWTLDLSEWDVKNVTTHEEFNAGVETKVITPTWE